jgi:serine/threonine protein kinase
VIMRLRPPSLPGHAHPTVHAFSLTLPPVSISTSNLRDLKSPNVLLSEEGVAKLADMGMSRSQAGPLVTAQTVMTPIWSAPEVRL